MQTVGLINVILFDTEVTNKLSSGMLVAQDDAITTAKHAIGAVCPWNNLVTLLNLAQCLVEGVTLNSALVGVIGFPIRNKINRRLRIEFKAYLMWFNSISSFQLPILVACEYNGPP